MSNEQVMIPMMDATMHIMEHMEARVDFLIVAAFSLEDSDKNAMGQFMNINGQKIPPLKIAMMLHAILMQYVLTNKEAVLSGLEMEQKNSGDVTAEVEKFISQMGMKPN